MTENHGEPTVISKWDPVLTKHVVDVMRPIVKRYFRSEVRGLENIPQRGCLVTANHSGGMLTPDWSVLAVDYYDTFGYDRPMYALAHDMLFAGPADRLLTSLGIIRATREIRERRRLPPGRGRRLFIGGQESQLYLSRGRWLSRAQMLPPIDIAAEFGDEPDADRVDAHVRAVMQTALARLARKRRLPIVG